MKNKKASIHKISVNMGFKSGPQVYTVFAVSPLMAKKAVKAILETQGFKQSEINSFKFTHEK